MGALAQDQASALLRQCLEDMDFHQVQEASQAELRRMQVEHQAAVVLWVVDSLAGFQWVPLGGHKAVHQQAHLQVQAISKVFLRSTFKDNLADQVSTKKLGKWI